MAVSPARAGDAIILVGDFNANSASLTIQDTVCSNVCSVGFAG